MDKSVFVIAMLLFSHIVNLCCDSLKYSFTLNSMLDTMYQLIIRIHKRDKLGLEK